MSATMALVRPFSGECCFQVIYFVSGIFSSAPDLRESDGSAWATEAKAERKRGENVDEDRGGAGGHHRGGIADD
jgi:hypothetical protein